MTFFFLSLILFDNESDIILALERCFSATLDIICAFQLQGLVCICNGLPYWIDNITATLKILDVLKDGSIA